MESNCLHFCTLGHLYKKTLKITPVNFCIFIYLLYIFTSAFIFLIGCCINDHHNFIPFSLVQIGLLSTLSKVIALITILLCISTHGEMTMR